MIVIVMMIKIDSLIIMKSYWIYILNYYYDMIDITRIEETIVYMIDDIIMEKGIVII